MNKTIEKDVEAGIPRSDAKIGNEAPVAAKELSVPSGKAAMGGESEAGYAKENKGPDVPTGDGYLGGEKDAQKGMPGTNTEIKGTVIAEKKADIKKEASTPTHVEHIETEVTSKIPRKEEYLGKEKEADSMINETPKAPSIPTGGSGGMGHESEAGYTKPAKSVDVPTGDAYLGHEKDAQSGLPGNSLKEKGTVIASEQRAKQLERLAKSRFEKAVKVASKYLAQGYIADDQYDSIVEDLSKLELNRIEAFAEAMIKRPNVQKQASSAPAVLTAAIVQESRSEVVTHEEEVSLADKLTNQFTIGSRKLDENLRKFNER